MAASKYKRSLKKKLNSARDVALSSLRKENTYLKKTLGEFYSQYSQQCELVKGFLSFVMLWMKSSQQAGDEPLHQNKASSVDDDFSSCEQSSTTDEDVTELRSQLDDVLKKNQQWLEYDQQREAYVMAILDRMSRLENRLNEANQAHSQQHNEAHSDGELEGQRAADTHQTLTREKERMSYMQDYYERLLQKAKEELEVLREQVDVNHQDLLITQIWWQEKESEVEELRQQLESERKSRGEQDDDDDDDDGDGDDDGSELRDESEDLQTRLDMDKRRSHIGDLQRQRGQQAHSSHQEVHPKSEFNTGQEMSTPPWNLLDQSFLECPKCQVAYPTSRYRELLTHIDICLA